MRLLDLFCGAGGAATGYRRVGFDVTGVDVAAQPRYPFGFHRADALDVLADPTFLAGFDVIHASPPCQDYSVTASLHTSGHPRLIEPTRARLLSAGVPYVMENVVGAPLFNPVRLCGSSFGLGVRRHRLFELSWPLLFVPPCAHYLQPEPIDVTGTGGPAGRLPGQGGGIHRKPRNLTHARAVMGIDWMNRRELSQAIPPAYTEFIGTQLLDHLTTTSAAEAAA
ncbi:MAG: hypothetical protein DLM59_02320 [Pseudonocardiales bacterium]|nr:MAG: hypothetical protein DLM59_02320 [Pseudonocardiales bacterium]